MGAIVEPERAVQVAALGDRDAAAAPAGVWRNSASGTAAMRLPCVSATYSVPSKPSAVAGGADDERRFAGALGEAVGDHLLGGHDRRLCPQALRSSMRTTVPSSVGVSPSATVPLRTLVTNSALNGPSRDRGQVPRAVDRCAGDRLDDVAAAVEHDQAAGLSRWRLCRWSWAGCRRPRSRPAGSRAPSSGRRRPGTDRGASRVDLGEQRAGARSGVTCTIVVPVPWRFSASLKLLMRMSPRTSAPTLLGHGHDPVGVHVAVGGHRAADR